MRRDYPPVHIAAAAACIVENYVNDELRPPTRFEQEARIVLGRWVEAQKIKTGEIISFPKELR